MLALNAKNTPDEVVLGWFSDLNELDYDAVKIHEFYTSKESGFVGRPLVFPSPLIILAKVLGENSVFNLRVNSKR